MKIVVAGASGLIGQALLPCLERAGHAVYSLVRKEELKGERKILWNPNQGKIEPSSLEGFDALISLSGENIGNGRWSDEKKERIEISRVKTTRLLADTIAHLQDPPKVWISTSAVGLYGERGEELLTEEAKPGEGFLAHVCEEWERATSAAEKRGIRVVKARLAVVLTPEGGLLKKILLPFKLGLGGRIGSGKQYMSWIAIEDLIAIISYLLKEESLRGAVNVVSPKAVTNEEFTKMVGKALHRPTLFPLPALVAKLLFGKEKAVELMLTSTRAYPEKLLNSGYVFHYPDLQKALQQCVHRS